MMKKTNYITFYCNDLLVEVKPRTLLLHSEISTPASRKPFKQRFVFCLARLRASLPRRIAER